jgi:hypothetical protein
MHRLSMILLLALAIVAAAQNPAPPATPAPAPQSEMQKWIDALDGQWQATYLQEVTSRFEADLAKLRQQYLATIDANLARASGAANLELAVAWRAERERFAAAQEDPAQDGETDVAATRTVRAGYRTELARLEKERASRAAVVHGRYDQVLAQAQAQLTQKQRIDDALLVKAKREAIAAAWLKPLAAPVAEKPAGPEPAAKLVAAAPATPASTPAIQTTRLSIISAKYGEPSGNRLVDTTEHLRQVLNSKQKTLKLNTRDGAEGKDPAPRVVKQTVITYSIHGKTKTKSFPEAYDLNFEADLR